MWKAPLITASDRIFPGLAYHDRKKEFYDIGNQIQSNLLLQMALYFNVWFFPCWFLIILGSLYAKYYELTEVYKVLATIVLLSITTLECVRLYLGYLGNLADKIPELASFWLVSTLLQFPLEMFFLLNGNMMSRLAERIANCVMISFLIVEIIMGTVALKNSANHHAKRFYLAQLYGINDKLN